MTDPDIYLDLQFKNELLDKANKKIEKLEEEHYDKDRDLMSLEAEMNKMAREHHFALSFIADLDEYIRYQRALSKYLKGKDD